MGEVAQDLAADAWDDAAATIGGEPPAAPAPTPDPLLGTVLDRRYRIDALLGKGGMGAVYRGEQVFIRRPVAIKVLHPAFAAHGEILERFRREAEIAVRLRSPFIVEALDFGQTSDGRAYLAMELLEGESLQALLRRTGRLPPAEVAVLLRDLLTGLHTVHAAGVVHRDLKPDNLWLAPSPTAGRVLKLLDFGIAKTAAPGPFAAATQLGMVMGTPEYLSPEQAFGYPVDHRADLYSVGILAFVMLAGRHPFPGLDARALLVAHATAEVPSLAEIVPGLARHPGLVELVRRATAKDRHARAPSAAALLALLPGDLPDAEAATQVAARPAVPSPEPDPPRRRGAWLAGALLVAALAWWWHTPYQRACRALAAGQPALALTALAGADPADPDVLLAKGRAKHATGNPGDGLAAYRAAAALDGRIWTRAGVLADLVDDLGGARAKEAADLLVEAGEPAVEGLLAATVDAGSYRRRWAAVEALRRLDREARVDLVPVYLADLAVDDCGVVARACRRLAELNDVRALEPLRRVAERREFLFEPCEVPPARAAMKALTRK